MCGESRERGCFRFVRRNLNGEGEMKNIDIRKLPELGTRVGIHGSARQQEVGGVFCAGVVVIVSSG
jgi:hypothetical protein